MLTLKHLCRSLSGMFSLMLFLGLRKITTFYFVSLSTKNRKWKQQNTTSSNGSNENCGIIDCKVQGNMMPSAEVPLRLQRNIDRERTKRKLLRADSDSQIQNATQRGIQCSDYLDSKQTFLQTCDVASWESSLIFIENPELIFPTSTSTGISPHLSPHTGKSGKAFLRKTLGK